MRGLFLLPLLAGCAAPAARHPPGLPPVPPAVLQSCPPGVVAPHPPPPPRSIAALLDWAIRVDRARADTEGARAECARRLDRLNEWIVDHPA